MNRSTSMATSRARPLLLVALLGGPAALLGCKSAARHDPGFNAAWNRLLAAGKRPFSTADAVADTLLGSAQHAARKKAQLVVPPAPPPAAPPAAPSAAMPAPPAPPEEIVEAHLPGSDPPPPAEAAPAPGDAPAATAEGSAPATLADADLAPVIRAGLGPLKLCYRASESTSSEGGGKAIVHFTILPSGAVDAVSVKAPSFEDSRLPGCVAAQVRAWRFPAFQGKPLEVTYPFVFAGS